MANYMQQAFMNARVYTLLALSVTLYHTLTTWVSIPQINNTCIRVILPCIWVFSLVVNLPFAIYFNINEKQACSEKWSSEKLGKIYFVSAQLFMCYFFPLVIMSICYGRIRRFLPKVKHDSVRSRCPCGIRRGWGRNGSERMIHVHWVKILRVMIVVFFLSWLPLLSFAVLVKFVEQDVFDGKIDLLDHIRPLPRWLADTTSYVNPIIYAYFKRNFREGYIIIILEECFKGKSFFGPLKLDIERRPNNQHRFLSRYNTSVRNGLMPSESLTIPPEPPKRDCRPEKDCYSSPGFLVVKVSALVNEPAGHKAMEAQ
ncbi:unnamed protein product [Darwinula stevensoni]|uniref:G-protein coupled receptors family 1 profile domain-containing protein n=1 Tax=Darwinula stevensoni TaxID=69355 RepID=A0A7R9A9Y8_9CRUS|nr:unnamed protein product [Darwinula stevensoni]CAG0897636.1 unnamed protein product [Darwinula stevensoni]